MSSSPTPERPATTATGATAASTAPAAHPAARTHAPVWAIPIAMVGGLLSACQAQINSRLALHVGDGFSAAAISFGVGLVIVGLIVLCRRDLRGRTADFTRDLRRGSFPWPYALGGLGGAVFVLGQGLSVALIGVALFIVCVVAGQTVTGLVVDRVGLGPGRQRPLTWPRVCGALLMVIAVALAMSGGVSSSAPWYLLALPVVSGVAVGIQQALNGRVTRQSGHFLVSTLGNFVVGTAVLVLAAVAHALAVGHGPGSLPVNPVLYLGGAIGVAFIAIAAYLAEPLGVLTLAMSTITGQIIGSVVIDVVTGSHLHALTVVGVVLTLVAALITAGVRPRRRVAR